MSPSRGFTLTEALVALALAATAVGAWTAVQFSSRGVDASQQLQQDYCAMLARVEERVKRDLRSCVAAREAAPANWELLVLEQGDGGHAEEQPVIWRARDGTVVERQSGAAVETFDFGPLLRGREFVFQIRQVKP